jgi:hypothetical protein
MKVVTIGRSKENNDIVINDEKVSRNHLQMIMDDQGNYSVLDLNSTNGTFVNGRRITGQVPLKTTDELRIGNTVLSWQCYFDSQVNTGTLHSKQPQPPVIQDSPHKPIPDPAPQKRWLIYVIIGSVVLLLAGGGIGWYKYKHGADSKVGAAKAEAEYQEAEAEYQKAEAEYQTAQADSAKAARDLAEKQALADRAQAEADRAARQAAESKSKEDQRIADAKAKEAKEAKEAMTKAENAAKQSAGVAEAKAKELQDKQKELEKIQEKLKEVTAELEKTKSELLKAQRESRKKLFNSYLRQMKGHEEEFCDQRSWGKVGNAKKTIETKYNNASDAEQQRIIEAMETFVNTIENTAPVPSKTGSKESSSQEKPKTSDKESSTQDTSKPNDKGTAKPDTLNKQ